jgi:hypothetical protein
MLDERVRRSLQRGKFGLSPRVQDVRGYCFAAS